MTWKIAAANSVHVLIYDDRDFTANFDNVNQDGILGGKIGTAGHCACGGRCCG